MLREFTEASCSDSFEHAWKQRQQALKVEKEWDAMLRSLLHQQNMAPMMQEKMAQLSQVQDEIADLEKSIEVMQGKRVRHVEKKKVLAEPLKKLQDEQLALQKQITQAMLEKCSTYLSKKNEPTLALVLERFVGILRGLKTADPASVQLYLRS